MVGVELRDRLIGDLILARDDLVSELVRQEVEPDALKDVLLRLAAPLEELPEVRVFGEALLLLLLERLSDLGVGHGDALGGGLARESI